jgi:NitT/TauT family transport system substrate-binding protein
MALLAAGCGSAASISTSASANGVPVLTKVPNLEKTTLSVSVLPSVDSAGFFVALHEGLFTQEGLKINYTPALGSEVIGPQLKGQIDITGGNYVSYVDSYANQNQHLRIFAEASVLAPGAQVIMVSARSHIKTLDDLRGHILGINPDINVGFLLVSQVLAENGLPLSKHSSTTAVVLPAKPIDFFAMGQALNSGQVDAAAMVEPTASEFAAQDGFRVLADLDQGSTNQFPIEGYAVTPAWAKANPDTLRAFYIALEAGQQIADTQRGAVEAALTSLKAPEDGQVDRVLASMVSLPSFPLGVDTGRLQRTADVMLRLGFLKKRFNVGSMVLTVPAGG